MIESFARHFTRAWATSCSNNKRMLLKNNNTEHLEALCKSKWMSLAFYAQQRAHRVKLPFSLQVYWTSQEEKDLGALTNLPSSIQAERSACQPVGVLRIPAYPATSDSWKWHGIGDWYPTRRKLSAFKAGGWERFGAQREPWKRDVALPMQGSAGAAELVNQFFNWEARRGGDRYWDNHCSSTPFHLFDSLPDC